MKNAGYGKDAEVPQGCAGIRVGGDVEQAHQEKYGNILQVIQVVPERTLSDLAFISVYLHIIINMRLRCFEVTGQ